MKFKINSEVNIATILNLLFDQLHIDKYYHIDFDGLIFTVVKGDKYFMSTKINKIKLKPDDKRIAKLGRNFLETYRLSDKQVNNLNKSFQELIDAGFIIGKWTPIPKARTHIYED